MTNLADQVWMTPAALAALQAELAELDERGDGDGDLARMVELRTLIRKVEVSAKPDDGLVEPGMTVTVRFEGDGSNERFLLGSREMAHSGVDVDVYSPTSPLGAAITGRHVGDEVSYLAPSGATLNVTVLEAVPFV